MTKRTRPAYFRKCYCNQGRNLAFYLPGKYFLEYARKVLTRLVSIPYRSCMTVPQLDHVLQRMQKTLEEKSQRIYTLNDELIELQPKYDRFLEVARQLESDQDLVYKLRTVLASENASEDGKEKSGYKLWEMIEIYLRFVREAQIANIAHYLAWIGMTTSVQAIDSAVRTHPERFVIESRSREKFIRLKGEQYASASTRPTTTTKPRK